MSKKLLDDEELALVFPDYFMIDSHGEILSQEKRHDFDEVKNERSTRAWGLYNV